MLIRIPKRGKSLSFNEQDVLRLVLDWDRKELEITKVNGASSCAFDLSEHQGSYFACVFLSQGCKVSILSNQ